MPNGHGLGSKPSKLPMHQRPMISEVQPEIVKNINLKLDVPLQYRERYDQGREGACVGFGYSWMMSIRNRRFYDASWLYHEAQENDEWVETPPEEGTSAAAGAKVLIEKGHRRIIGGVSWVPSIKEGISNVRWASLTGVVDELRTSISGGLPFGNSIPWYQNFDEPKWDRERGWIIGEGDLGKIRGYHFICGYGAQDKYECFNLINNWGLDYPLVKMPYKTVERLRQEDSEFPIITDR